MKNLFVLLLCLAVFNWYQSVLIGTFSSPAYNMASSHSSETSSTTTVPQKYKEPSLVLRSQANAMKVNVETKVETRVADFKEKYKDATDEELNEFIDRAFEDVEMEVRNQLANMKEEVKSHAPKKPVRIPDESDEVYQRKLTQYDQDKQDYMQYVGFVAGFLKGLANLFKEIFQSIREFFRSLWNWIKQALKNIAKRVSDFVNFLKEKIASGIEALFG